MNSLQIIHKNRNRRGFTIIEAAIATIIIGIGVTAMMTLFGTCTKVSDFSSKMSTGIFLAEQMRNMTDEVSYANLPALNGAVYNGADSDGNPVDGLSGYSQELTVQSVNWQSMANALPGSEIVVVTAVVTHNNQKLSQLSWIRTE